MLTVLQHNFSNLKPRVLNFLVMCEKNCTSNIISKRFHDMMLGLFLFVYGSLCFVCCHLEILKILIFWHL